MSKYPSKMDKKINNDKGLKGDAAQSSGPGSTLVSPPKTVEDTASIRIAPPHKSYRHREITSIARKAGLPPAAIEFSPNLQRFLRMNPYDNRIYYDPVDRYWYIGMKDGPHWGGALFLRVLCRGSKAETFSYGTRITDRFVDRTEQFWKCAAYFGRRMFKWY